MTAPTRAGLPRAVLRVVQDFGRHVLVDPVREGRVRTHRWPRGLVPIAIVALSGYVLAVAFVLLAGPLRTVFPLDVATGTLELSLPHFAVGAGFVLIVLALSLAQTAALHVPLWLGIVVTLLSTVVLLFIGAGDTSAGEVVTPGRVASMLAAAGVWALLVARRRRRFAWGEFAVVFAAMAIGIAVPLWNVSVAASALSVSPGAMLVASTLQTIGSLAVPMSLAAGAAVVQLACSMATESVASVRRHLPPALGVALLLALTGWRLWVAVEQIVTGDVRPGPLVAAVALLGVTIGLWVLLARLRGRAPTATPAQLQSRFAAVAQPLAIFLTIGVFPATIVYTLSYVVFAYTFVDAPVVVFDAIGDALTSRTAIWGARLVVGVVLLVLAVRHARQARDVSPELFGAMGVVIVTISIAGLFGLDSLLWNGPSLTLVVTAAAVALLCWWGPRRRLTAPRGAAVGTALLIAALFDQRTFVEDPLKVLFGFTGFAFLLFGFVWALLTGGASANKASRRYPRSARVLFMFANSLFGVTILAFSALARDPAFAIDLGPLAGLGDQLLGTGLLAAALLAALAASVGNGLAVADRPDVTRSEAHRPG